MASRFFFTFTTLLIMAGGAGFFVAAGWIPWTYPVVFFAVALAVWGFVARRKRPVAPSTTGDATLTAARNTL